VLGRVKIWAAVLRNRWRAARLRWSGADVGRGCRVAAGVCVRRGFAGGRKGWVVIGPGAVLDQGVLLDAWGGRIEVGANVFLGPYTVVYGHGGVTIGADTLIAMHCRILSSDHAVPLPGTPIRSQPDRLLSTAVGRDVWLGAGVTVLGGVTIGDGCVVGAGAVVSSDLPANSVALGIPARVVKTRS
jgi:acetyltransferase-like isoleucine patch superfamily enzyme